MKACDQYVNVTPATQPAGRGVQRGWWMMGVITSI